MAKSVLWVVRLAVESLSISVALFDNVYCLRMGVEESRSKISLLDQMAVNHSKAQIFVLTYNPTVPTLPKVCETKIENNHLVQSRLPNCIL